MATYQPLPEVALWDPMAASLKCAEAEVRMGFVRKVYGILSAQIALTVAIAGPLVYQGKPFLMTHAWLVPVSMVFLLTTLCAMSCCQETMRRFPTNYCFLFLFTAAEGVLIGFTGAMYTWQSVTLAAGVTALMFFGLTVYAFNTKTDF